MTAATSEVNHEVEVTDLAHLHSPDVHKHHGNNAASVPLPLHQSGWASGNYQKPGTLSYKDTVYE